MIAFAPVAALVAHRPFRKELFQQGMRRVAGNLRSEHFGFTRVKAYSGFCAGLDIGDHSAA
jgi:hypothetical protein